MVNKKNIIFICSLFCITNLLGVQNVAGQKYYLKQCSACHGKGNRGGGLAASYEWKEYFNNGASELISFHYDEPSSLVYFNSKKFKKQSKKLSSFLVEFASDSQSIPSCNN